MRRRASRQVEAFDGISWGLITDYTLINEKFLVEEVFKYRNANPGVQLHWKMTTANQKHNRPEFDFAWSLVKSGAFDSVYDSWSLTFNLVEHHPNLMWDPLHFYGPVYQFLNQVLIAHVCSVDNLST